MRKVKDVVYDYSEIERKVRKATSNKPVRATSTQMKEIADATHDPSQFPQIMGILWKRLNEPGKYWRHVYKGLIVLEYIILNGSDQVSLAARENIFAIQTLKDFRMIDSDDRDQGQHVRQLASKIVDLLRDDQKLKEQREKYSAARSRVHSSAPNNKDYYDSGAYDSGYGGDRGGSGGGSGGGYNRRTSNRNDSLAAEEERQLQEALALSKREADEEERRRRMREETDPDLQAALALSKVDNMPDPFGQPQTAANNDPFGLGDVFSSTPAPPSNDPFGGYNSYGAGSYSTPTPDPFGSSAPPPANDFFSTPSHTSAPNPWETPASKPASGPSDPWGMSAGSGPAPAAAAATATKAPQKFDANRQLAEIARNAQKIDEFAGLRGPSGPPSAPAPAASFPTVSSAPADPFGAAPPSFSQPSSQPPPTSFVQPSYAQPQPPAMDPFSTPVAPQMASQPPMHQPPSASSLSGGNSAGIGGSASAGANPWDLAPISAALPAAQPTQPPQYGGAPLNVGPSQPLQQQQARLASQPQQQQQQAKPTMFDKHKDLVNLDSLLSTGTSKSTSSGYSPKNPFGLTSGATSSGQKANPFNTTSGVPLNQLRASSPVGGMGMQDPYASAGVYGPGMAGGAQMGYGQQQYGGYGQPTTGGYPTGGSGYSTGGTMGQGSGNPFA